MRQYEVWGAQTAFTSKSNKVIILYRINNKELLYFPYSVWNLS